MRVMTLVLMHVTRAVSGFDRSCHSLVVVPLPVPALVGLVSCYQRYQIINLSYLGLTVLLKTTCPMGGG